MNINERKQEYNRIMKFDFFKRLKIEDHPKRELIFNLAYKIGRSHGWGKVISYGGELVRLIED